MLASLLVSSCGTYKVENYDKDDGIYASNNTPVAEEIIVEAESKEDKNNYYKQYFQTKSLDYQDLPEDNTILTDVEAYHSKDTLDADGYVITEKREGRTNTDVVIITDMTEGKTHTDGIILTDMREGRTHTDGIILIDMREGRTHKDCIILTDMREGRTHKCDRL